MDGSDLGLKSSSSDLNKNKKTLPRI
uniref:Uncharacterized protein n=1 Tax=Arundo donax TaxID=35708 RepID=A0A0A9C8H5_ARUDO